MNFAVLGIGYVKSDYTTESIQWSGYGIEFDFVDDVKLALEKLCRRKYVCIALCMDHIPSESLTLLRNAQPIPIVVVPSVYTSEERFSCVRLGAAQYIRTSCKGKPAELDDRDSVRSYLGLPFHERKPLTIIAVHELSFCLEYRSVEVRGQAVKLTEKEFDILALLIMNQRQVFTHDMITDAIWKEEPNIYSRNAIMTQISNLRRKLKMSPEMPDYIKSVHGVGYAFEPP